MEKINIYSAYLPDTAITDKQAVISAMVAVAKENLTDPQRLVADIMQHESVMATDLLANVAIPHAKSAAVLNPFIVVTTIAKGCIWNKQNKVQLVILIAAGQQAQQQHLDMIAKLATHLADDDFVAELLNCPIPQLAEKIRSIYE